MAKLGDILKSQGVTCTNESPMIGLQIINIPMDADLISKLFDLIDICSDYYAKEIKHGIFKYSYNFYLSIFTTWPK